MALDEKSLELAHRLVERLERLSADSTFAHRASGLRGSLLRTIDEIESGKQAGMADLDQLIEFGFEILNQAAREIGES